MVKELNAQTFQTEVLSSDKVTLVDFFAQWCGPCKMMAPVLEQLSGQLSDRYQIVKVDIDDNMELAQEYGVQAVPTMIIFKDGAAAQTIVGATSAETLKNQLQNF